MKYRYPLQEATDDLKRAVWKKASPIPDYDADVWRRDMCGSAIKYSDHGNTDSVYGWEIDHIKPTARGGTDDLSNLQPLQWENNRRKGDTYPWSCKQAAE